MKDAMKSVLRIAVSITLVALLWEALYPGYYDPKTLTMLSSARASSPLQNRDRLRTYLPTSPLRNHLKQQIIPIPNHHLPLRISNRDQSPR